MIEVIKVKFNNNICYCLTNNNKVKRGDAVVANISGKSDYGICIENHKAIEQKDFGLDSNFIVRKANKDDINKNCDNIKKSQLAITEAQKIANKLKLNMKFIDASYTYDKKQLYLMYYSDDRIDFRELAKKLAQKYKTRIELRQIGIRDKAKIIGGIGPCGLFLCCNTFLTSFNSVSINMAKNQFLALNPSKINGVCGRLLCCLEYEDEMYTKLKKDFPKVGSQVHLKDGIGKVIGIDIFNRKCRVELEKNNIIEISVESINDKVG